jgi:hypothetical protein
LADILNGDSTVEALHLQVLFERMAENMLQLFGQLWRPQQTLSISFYSRTDATTMWLITE